MGAPSPGSWEEQVGLLLPVNEQGDAGISSAGIAQCHEELTPFFPAVHLDGDG